jgi:hypothetical protein
MSYLQKQNKKNNKKKSEINIHVIKSCALLGHPSQGMLLP